MPERPENCENACPGLTRLEQQVDDIRRQNGQDHKEFRQQIQEMEKADAKQQERFERLMDTLIEVKADTKAANEKLSAFATKADNVDKLERDVDELKGKSGKTWEEIKSKALGWAVALILAIVAAALGLSKFL